MDINDLSGKAVAFVIVGVVLSIGVTILTNLASGQTGAAAAATNNATAGLAQLANYLPTIGLVVAAAVVIGTLFMAFQK
jgi:hypothetical protein